MTLHAYRSQRVEALVDALSRAMVEGRPDDPFAPIPIVVGSRGMERWLRHELATRLGAVARLEFLFPRATFDRAARWLVDAPRALDPWSAVPPASAARDPWGEARLMLRVLERTRARLEAPSFARVRRYLGEVGPDVGARELAFAEQVAAVVARLHYDRPEDALAFASHPERADAAHAWLAALVADLEGETDERSPARRFAELAALPPTGSARSLFVFGLSTMRPGDKLRLGALSRHLEVHLFALAPSSEWWEDVRKRSAQLAALRKATDPHEIEALLAELARNNALLAADGEPSRDLQLWLEEVGYDEPIAPAPIAPGRTLLERLQAWIDRAEDNPRAGGPDGAPWRAHAGCASIEIHACHGALRQCEALRDELLRRFAADESLEPRHVLVMTPDIATYAPMLAAVFARRSAGAPAIPLHVADLGLRAQNPIAEALLSILALADERVTASRLLDLLGSSPLRARFSLSEQDVADLRELVVASGIRWGWDADDRARHDQPAIDQNTVRFGLERLALGVLMHDPGGLGVVASGEGALAPAVPLELATRDRVERFGKLADVCDRLQQVVARLEAPATLGAWRRRLVAILDELTQLDEEASWLRAQVDEALSALLPDEGDEGRAFDRAAVVARLRGAFELSQHGDRPLTGAVTVCALEPMRSVPFRVIAMLGLDDGAFPRAARTPEWDPFAEGRRGEYDRRVIDRHLFLEAVLCARDALLLFGTGFESKRGVEVPLSLAVSELAETIGVGVGREPGALPHRHPLQPWSERGYLDPERLPFDTQWLEGARALRGERVVSGLAASRSDAAWPLDEAAGRTLTVEALARALVRPQQELLARRLGLALGDDGAEVLDREPLESDGLDDWSLRDRVLCEARDELPAPDALDALAARLGAEGVLPPKGAGRHALVSSLEAVADARRRAAEVAGDRRDALAVACEIDGLLVSGVATDVRAEGGELRFVELTAHKTPGAKQQLVAWIRLLVAVAAGEPARAAHVIGCDASVELRAPDHAARAREHLAALVTTYREARRATLPLFATLSPAIAAARLADPARPARAIVESEASSWEGSAFHGGDSDDRWVGALFGHLAFDDLVDRAEELVQLSTRVWGPLLAAVVRKRRAKAGEGA